MSPLTGGVAVSDLDGTVADTRHRAHLCPTRNPDSTWTEYANACTGDTPISGPIALLRALHTAGCDIHLLTNRPIVAQKSTVTWLNTVAQLTWNHLRMSPRTTPGDPVEAALAYLTELRDRRSNIVVYLNDDPRIVLAAEAAGFPAVCVNPAYPHRDNA